MTPGGGHGYANPLNICPPDRHMAKIWHNANQTISHSAWRAPSFNSEKFDIGGLHAASDNYFTIQRDGLYIFGADVRITSGNNLLNQQRFQVNGSVINVRSISNADGNAYHMPPLYGMAELSANDTLKYEIYVNDVDRTLETVDSHGPSVWIMEIGRLG
jgi:hypothetical protein